MSFKENEEKDIDIAGSTLNLAGLNFFIYILTSIWGGSILTRGEPLIYLGLSGIGLSFGFFWTPFTSIFVHGHLAHLGGNLIYLFIFGYRLEENGFKGKPIYFAYIVTGVLAGVLSLPIFPSNSISVGASGAVFGLLGVNYGFLRYHKDPNKNKVLFVSLFLFIFASGPNTNVFAHLFGLIAGMILGNSEYFNEMRDTSIPLKIGVNRDPKYHEYR